MPLTLVKEGTVASIIRVGGKEEVERHLENMGFVSGTSVTAVSVNDSSMTVNVEESRVTISKEMADKIMVQAGRGYEKERSINKVRTLKGVKCRSTVAVVKLHGEGTVKRQVVDMGITKGTEVYVRKVAPLGDPVEMNVRGCELSLGKASTEMIEAQWKLLFFRRMS